MAILVKNILDSFFTTPVGWRQKLFKEWHTVVGKLSKRMCLQKIYKDTLVIGVYESHWMQELYMLSRFLIQSINKHLGNNYVKNLRFKLVERESLNYVKSNRIYTKYKPPLIKLTAKEQKALVPIKDDQLRKALTDFLACCIGKNG